MRSDENIHFRKRDEGELGDFGETKPTNSFSGGETDHLFLSDVGEQFYDLDLLSGLAHPGDGRTACQLDYDRDGWIDFVVASANAPTVQLYRNRIGERLRPNTSPPPMIALRFVGGNRGTAPSADWSVRSGIGAYATIDIGGPPLIREVRCGDGRAAVHSRTMLVGVGRANEVRSIRVRWPSGRVQSERNLPVGRLVTIYENPADSPTGEPFHVTPYVENAASENPAPRAEAQRLALSLPGGDAPPRLHLVTAMSTHCKSCKKLQPQVRLLRQSFAPVDVAIWGVDTDLTETSEDLRRYVREHGPAYEVLADLPMDERSRVRDFVLDVFQDDLTPVTIVTDASGRILKTVAGIPSVSDVRELLGDG